MTRPTVGEVMTFFIPKIFLHRKSVEATVDHSDCAGHKAGGIGNEILDGAAKLFGFTETLERSLTDDIGAALGQ